MKTIKVAFVDFWPRFIIMDSIFYNILKKNFEVVVTDLSEARAFRQ